MLRCLRFAEEHSGEGSTLHSRFAPGYAQVDSRLGRVAPKRGRHRVPLWLSGLLKGKVARSPPPAADETRLQASAVNNRKRPQDNYGSATSNSVVAVSNLLETRSKSLSVRRGLGKLTLNETDLNFGDPLQPNDEYGASFECCAEADEAPTAYSTAERQVMACSISAGEAGETSYETRQAAADWKSLKQEDVSMKSSRMESGVSRVMQVSDCPTSNSFGTGSGLKANHLQFLRTIGSGSFASVQLAMYKDKSEPIAIKIIDSSSHRAQIRSEVSVLRMARAHDCENIVHYHEIVEDGNRVMILMELMDVGSIDGLYRRSSVKRLSESVVRAIAWQTLRALQFVHNVCHRVHRDVKPSNLLLNRLGQVKLADFGLSSSISVQKNPQKDTSDLGVHGPVREGKFVGTCLYMAPEMLRASPYDYRADIYSLGISLLECLQGKHPNYEDYLGCRGHLDLIVTLLEKGSPEIPQEIRLSSNARNFLALCLAQDYRQRPSCQELLKHRWFDRLKIPKAPIKNAHLPAPSRSARFTDSMHHCTNTVKRSNSPFPGRPTATREDKQVLSRPSLDLNSMHGSLHPEGIDAVQGRRTASCFSDLEQRIADENSREEIAVFLRLLGITLDGSILQAPQMR